MAVGLKYVVLLHFTLLDVPGIISRSNILCPPTSFYHECWIRRFPGLFLNLPGSQKRGARILQKQSDVSASLCSRKCCDQVPCNMAAFMDNNDGQDNCHLVYCPQPESCILQLQERAVLFTVTAGVDPDLLVFNKVGQVDFNPRSSLKWERPNDSHAQASSSVHTPALLTSLAPSTKQQVSTSHNSPHHHPLSPPRPSPQHSPLRSLPPTHSPPLTAPAVSENPFITPSGTRSSSGSAFTEKSNLSMPPLGQPRPNLQSPAHLDSSKQHLNETKNHNGRNQSSDADLDDTRDPLMNLWLLPGLLGSSLALMCCCAGILALGCCRRRKRGRYRPGHARDTGRGTLIKCTLLKEK
ncbi:MANSC domain-containing protein 4 [Pelobates fuscus]|uniref:MANSC domain-containing protein 4 n=1 Tax=Pelobates fuscus TaxID=191477 RepID=UPI002FE44C8E